MTRSRLHFLVPGSLERRSGGTLYDARMIVALRAQGHDVAVHELGGRFPLADEAARAAARFALAGVRPGDVVVVDGLALDALDTRTWPMAAACVPLLHMPVEATRGLDPASLSALVAGEEAWLRRADRIVVTSGYGAERLVERGVAARRIAIVEPGVDRQAVRDDRSARYVEPSPGRAGGEATAARGPAARVRLLSVGAVTAVKGHGVLVQALGRLRHLRWRLRIVGSTSVEPDTWHSLQDEIRRQRLDRRIRFIGELPPDQVADAYRDADVFVLPSLYESYGMALAEAAVAGLALVASAAGAVPTTPAGRAAVLVPPGDVAALALALEPVIRDAKLRHRLAADARAASAEIESWNDASRRFAAEVWGHSLEHTSGGPAQTYAYA